MGRPLMYLACTHAGHRLAGTAALIAAAVLAVVTAHPAAAQDSFRIETYAGGCLEIADASTHNGAPLQQYRCLGTDNQLFTTKDAGDGLVGIKTFAGQCLEVLDSDQDDSIVQGDCEDRYVFQEFQIHDLGDGTVLIEAHNTLYWTIEEAHPGLLAPVVLDGPSSVSPAGALHPAAGLLRHRRTPALRRTQHHAPADRRPQTADRRPQTADRRPQTADRGPGSRRSAHPGRRRPPLDGLDVLRRMGLARELARPLLRSPL
ncbi:RICIN domain-containing protein [Streptomyces collinus]|uniref:RICIN domain-containing protein n=1 Tax=Streptomyces collinus TaxID=42684 RepID=UPI0033288546